MIRTLKDALAFIQRHGAVPMTRRGELPCFVDAVAGGPVKGSWWGHPKGQMKPSRLTAQKTEQRTLNGPSIPPRRRGRRSWRAGPR